MLTPRVGKRRPSFDSWRLVVPSHSIYMIEHHAVNIYMGMEIEFHIFLFCVVTTLSEWYVAY
jgi:hypothetical protein